MASSWQDLFINVAVDTFIFKNNRITLFSWFTFIPKTDMMLPKIGVTFYCGERSESEASLKTSDLGTPCKAFQEINVDIIYAINDVASNLWY